MRHMSRPHRSPLDTFDDAYRLLVTGPHPLSLDASDLDHDLPARPVGGRAQVDLLHPSYEFAYRDAVVAELVTPPSQDRWQGSSGWPACCCPGCGALPDGWPATTRATHRRSRRRRPHRPPGCPDRIRPRPARRRRSAAVAAYRYVARVRCRELKESGRHVSQSVSAAPGGAHRATPISPLPSRTDIATTMRPSLVALVKGGHRSVPGYARFVAAR